MCDVFAICEHRAVSFRSCLFVWWYVHRCRSSCTTAVESYRSICVCVCNILCCARGQKQIVTRTFCNARLQVNIWWEIQIHTLNENEKSKESGSTSPLVNIDPANNSSLITIELIAQLVNVHIAQNIFGAHFKSFNAIHLHIYDMNK